MSISGEGPNWDNRTIFVGDNLDVLRGMNSNTVDLIYLDPPFNSNRTYSALAGSPSEGAGFRDAWTFGDIDLTWPGLIRFEHPILHRVIAAAGDTAGEGMASYLIMMSVRLLEMKRVLKKTGSIWLHCDPTASHYLKVVMDAIFGRRRFRNEVIWHYYNKFGGGRRVFGRNYDQILFYTMGDNYAFHPQAEERERPVRQLVRENTGGVLRNKRDESGSPMYRVSTRRKVDSVWRIPGLQARSRQYRGYPTQKPVALLDRIILASSDEDDIVLDPFCGCATTCVAAERQNRRWVGIDLSPLAQRLGERRVQEELALAALGLVLRDDVPRRTDLGPLAPHRSRETVDALWNRQYGLCAGCLDFHERAEMVVDHVVAPSQGGADYLANLQLLCRSCRNQKGATRQADFLARMRADGSAERMRTVRLAHTLASSRVAHHTPGYANR